MSQMWRRQNGRAASAASTTRLALCVAWSLASGSATLAATLPGVTSSSTSCARGTIRCGRGMQPGPLTPTLLDRRLVPIDMKPGGRGDAIVQQPFAGLNLAGAFAANYSTPRSKFVLNRAQSTPSTPVTPQPSCGPTLAGMPSSGFSPGRNNPGVLQLRIPQSVPHGVRSGEGRLGCRFAVPCLRGGGSGSQGTAKTHSTDFAEHQNFVYVG